MHQKTTGLLNTASDCSSGGKGLEILFPIYGWDIIRNTMNKELVPDSLIYNNPTVTITYRCFEKVAVNDIVSTFRVWYCTKIL